jgi:hypothetical protein
MRSIRPVQECRDGGAVFAELEAPPGIDDRALTEAAPSWEKAGLPDGAPNGRNDNLSLPGGRDRSWLPRHCCVSLARARDLSEEQPCP